MAAISLTSVLCLSGCCQENQPVVGNQPDACLNAVGAHSSIATQYREIRSIEDRGTHQHWILLQNLNRPAAPALLLQGAQGLPCGRFRIEKSGSRSKSDARSFQPPVIRAGDYLIVSEHSSELDADLEATALKSAVIGNSLTVRLKAGGRTLSVIATGPGRATFLQKGIEVRR
jgi:hypothetical protein